MGKYAFVIDSTLATNISALKAEGITVQPLYVIVDNQPFKDMVELDAESFYQAVREGKNCSTSQPSAGDFLATYEQLATDGVTDIFVFTLSKKLSGTFQSATTAATMIDAVAVHVIDSRTVAAVGSIGVREVIAFAQKNQSVAAIQQFAEQLFERVTIYVCVNNLEALKKGGRLSPAKAAIGNLLQIRPILCIRDGEIDVIGKERTLKKSYKNIISQIQGKKIHRALLLHSSNHALLSGLEAELTQAMPGLQWEVSDLSPVVGVHIGAEACAVAIIEE